MLSCLLISPRGAHRLILLTALHPTLRNRVDIAEGLLNDMSTQVAATPPTGDDAAQSKFTYELRLSIDSFAPYRALPPYLALAPLHPSRPSAGIRTM